MCLSLPPARRLTYCALLIKYREIFVLCHLAQTKKKKLNIPLFLHVNQTYSRHCNILTSKPSVIGRKISRRIYAEIKLRKLTRAPRVRFFLNRQYPASRKRREALLWAKKICRGPSGSRTRGLLASNARIIPLDQRTPYYPPSPPLPNGR